MFSVWNHGGGLPYWVENLRSISNCVWSGDCNVDWGNSSGIGTFAGSNNGVTQIGQKWDILGMS